MKCWVARDKKGTQQEHRLYFFKDEPDVDGSTGEQQSDLGHCGYISLEIFENILGCKVGCGSRFQVEITCEKIRSKR